MPAWNIPDELADMLEEVDKGRMAPRFGRNSRLRRVPMSLVEMLEIAGKRIIPVELQEKARLVIDKCAAVEQKENRQQAQECMASVVPLAVTYSKTFGVDRCYCSQRFRYSVFGGSVNFA